MFSRYDRDYSIPIAKRVVEPDDEPFSIAEARMHLRNPERTDNDAEIFDFIVSAREQAEHKTGRALMPQTWELYLDRFPCEYSGLYRRHDRSDTIKLLRPPLIAVTSVKYVDSNGVLQTMDPTAYAVDETGMHARVRIAYGGSWPTTRLDDVNVVTVRYTCGYTDRELIPAGIKNWMKLAIEYFDKNRGLTVEREPFHSPFADRMLDVHLTGD